MSPDKARALLGEYVFAGSTTLAYSLKGLLEGDALEAQEHAETRAELQNLASAEVVDAFDLLAEENGRRWLLERKRARRAVKKYGPRVAAEAAEASSAQAVFAVMDETAKTPAGVVVASPRESRPRPRRASSRTSADDDGLADLPSRRCSRCGGALRPLLPSPHWRCDPCAGATWERLVAHEFEHVLDEAERIVREATA
jgi:hypothetical protein